MLNFVSLKHIRAFFPPLLYVNIDCPSNFNFSDSAMIVDTLAFIIFCGLTLKIFFIPVINVNIGFLTKLLRFPPPPFM